MDHRLTEFGTHNPTVRAFTTAARLGYLASQPAVLLIMERRAKDVTNAFHELVAVHPEIRAKLKAIFTAASGIGPES